MTDGFVRPVLHVSSGEASLRFHAPAPAVEMAGAGPIDESPTFPEGDPTVTVPKAAG